MLKFAFTLVLIAGVVRFGPGLFKIRVIDCRLNHYPCPLQLEPVLLGFRGRNIFSLSAGPVSRQLMSFDPTLIEVKVSKTLPSKLMLDLTRRLPVAVIKIQPDGPEFYLDKTGFVYLPPTLLNQPLAVVLWPKELPLAEGQSGLSLNLAQLINTLTAYFVAYTEVIRLSEETYLVKTALGPEAVIKADADFTSPVASLQFILTNIKIGEASPVKIDLRFDKPILIY